MRDNMTPDRLYTARDMAKIGCDDCKGCSYCCQEMGESVVLTPFDICELTQHLGRSFDELMEDKIELYMTDGMVLPNLKMSGETKAYGSKEVCGFLNEEGRCSIHAFRPGLCRLFPLGRNYEIKQMETEDGIKEIKGFQYFIVKDSCPNLNGTKVKIEKWLGIPNLKKNEEFITTWHYFCKDFQEEIQELLKAGEDDKVKKINLSMLELFYRKPYEKERDFYEQFEERMKVFD
ncbi:YkgJ family cysteine cluster protein [bacterium 1XD8-76]|nr:YkgJ family cysteine cluster protein [bacterium 1XD8-76]